MRIRQRWQQIGRPAIRCQGRLQGAGCVQGDAQTQMGVRICRPVCDGAAQGIDRLADQATFQAGEAEIVQNAGIARITQRCRAQQRNGLGGPAGVEPLGSLGEEHGGGVAGQRQERQVFFFLKKRTKKLLPMAYAAGESATAD